MFINGEMFQILINEEINIYLLTMTKIEHYLYTLPVKFPDTQ